MCWVPTLAAVSAMDKQFEDWWCLSSYMGPEVALLSLCRIVLKGSRWRATFVAWAAWTLNNWCELALVLEARTLLSELPQLGAAVRPDLHLLVQH